MGPLPKNQAVTDSIVAAISFYCIVHCPLARLNRELNQVNRMNTTVNIVCYKSKTLANGEHPLMIRICKDGKKKYKSLGVSVNPAHWNFAKNVLKRHKPKIRCIC